MLDRARAALGLLHTRTVSVDGLALRVPPGVIDPVLFRSGAWFARQLARRVTPGARLLDLGCGTGVVGLLARRAGATVVAVDIEPAAVQAARENGLPDVRQGDLFAPVAGERFDLVAFNPPYLAGEPRGRLDRQRSLGRALYGGPELEVVRRFGEQVAGHLAPGGVAWVCWSDRAPEAPRKLLGRDWEEVGSAVVEGEMLSLWNRLDPTSRRPPKASKAL